MSHQTPTYRRVLLKFSGEALMGEAAFGIDPLILSRIAQEVGELIQLGVQVGLVIGGGNIFRGVGLVANGIDRVSADYMGMLATVMNGIALQNALHQLGFKADIMSAIGMAPICALYNRHQAIDSLENGSVVIFTAGTGNPFFTTDSAASLRAIEIGAELMIKATKVDGVYSADPMRVPDAQRFAQLSYDEVLTQQLGVMDLTAVLLCRDHRLPLRVLDMMKTGALIRAINGGDEGTLIQ